jgi:hypothetical protein
VNRSLSFLVPTPAAPDPFGFVARDVGRRSRGWFSSSNENSQPVAVHVPGWLFSHQTPSKIIAVATAIFEGKPEPTDEELDKEFPKTGGCVSVVLTILIGIGMLAASIWCDSGSELMEIRAVRFCTVQPIEVRREHTGSANHAAQPISCCDDWSGCGPAHTTPCRPPGGHKSVPHLPGYDAV